MTGSDHPDSTQPISTIEDLDPEPVRGRGKGPRLDLVLGVPLLLIVVMFAVWQWWHQDYISSQYRAGQEAAGRSDLDAALHYYTEASGYNDADSLAMNMGDKIDERDRLYSSAVVYAYGGEWVQALRDIREVAKIQPDYKDVQAREAAALDNVYKGALEGTIVMREGANPPGLYYRTANTWVWLEGSDTRSQGGWTSSGGTVLFDVPDKNVTPVPTPESGSAYFGDYYKDRRFVLAQIAGDVVHFRGMESGPVQYVPIMGSDTGFWSMHFPSAQDPENLTDENIQYLNPIIGQGLFFSNLLYQAYSGTVSAPVQITGTTAISTGSTIAALDPGSNAYLLVEWSNASPYGSDEDTIINLYLCAAGSSEKRLVYTQTSGGLQSAMLSHAGHYAIVNAIKQSRAPDDKLTASYNRITTLLFDLAGNEPPRTLREVITNRNLSLQPQAGLATVFVEQGAFAGSLLLTEYDGAATTISIIDPAKAMTAQEAEYTIAQASTQASPTNNTWTVLQENEEGLLLDRHVQNRSVSESITQTLVYFPAKGLPESYSVQLPTPPGMASARTTKRSIMWSGVEYGQDANQLVTMSVYKLGRQGSVTGLSEANLVYTTKGATIESGAEANAYYSVSLGDNIMAYSLNGELHARTYDDSADVLLETGVSSIYETSRLNYYAGLLR